MEKEERDELYGFDSADLWELDMAFYKWLQPRLFRLTEIVTTDAPCYPNEYTFEEWKEQLEENLHKLNIILEFYELENACPDDYLTEEDRKIITEKYGDTVDSGILNMYSYRSCMKSFNEWFGKNVNNLWW